MKKRIVSLALALALCLGLAVPALALGYGEEYIGYPGGGASQQYRDVPATHWAFQSIATCSQRTWFNGYPDGTFRPEGLITREEAAKVFAVAMGLEIETDPTVTFTDTADNWAKAYIEATKPLFPNVANLQGTSSFRPKQTITREETIYALVVAWGYGSKTTNADLSILNMFSDTSSISAGVKPYMAVAVSEGLVAGLPDGTIAAQKGLTRAEFATLLARALSHGYGDTKQEFQAPKLTLDKYPSATDKSTLNITGSVTPADATVTLDGSNVRVSNGSFTLSLELKTGKNAFVLTAENTYGAKDSKTIDVERTEKLTLSVDLYESSTAAQTLTVTGSVTPASAKVTLDGKTVPVNSNGTFTLPLSLKVGANTFSLVAESAYGDREDQTISVERTEDLSISVDPYETNTDAQEVTVTGTVTPPSGVTLTLDGVEVPTTSAGAFSLTLPLVTGVNTFELSAKNANGSTAQKTLSIGREFLMPSIVIDREVQTYCPPGVVPTVAGHIENYNKDCGLYNAVGNQIALDENGYFTHQFYGENGGACGDLLFLEYHGQTIDQRSLESYAAYTVQAGQWLTELPDEVANNRQYYDVTAKTEYRYKTVEKKTSSESSLPGWTLVEKGGSWGAWSGWQDTPVGSHSTRKVETRKVETAPGKTEYRYGGWHDASNYGHFCPDLGKSDRGTSFTLHYTNWSTTRQTPKYTNWQYCDSSSHNHVGGRWYNGHHYWDRYGINGLAYYWEETRTTEPTYKTQYRYQDYNASNVFQRESAWSDWSEQAKEPGTWSTMDVRTLYYYTPRI